MHFRSHFVVLAQRVFTCGFEFLQDPLLQLCFIPLQCWWTKMNLLMWYPHDCVNAQYWIGGGGLHQWATYSKDIDSVEAKLSTKNLQKEPSVPDSIGQDCRFSEQYLPWTKLNLAFWWTKMFRNGDLAKMKDSHVFSDWSKLPSSFRVK